MQVERVIIHNFARVKHLEIDLSRPGLYAVEGRNLDVGSSNESGKSTIFSMALPWCWYGRYPGGPARPGKEVVNPTTDGDCYVETYLKDNGLPIVIKRTQMEGVKHNESNLYVNMNGEERSFDLSKKDPTESSKYVVQLLGRDYETFIRQCILSMEDFQPVTRMTNAVLKSFFMDSILNVEWTQNCLARAKNEKGRLEAVIAEAKYGRQSTLKLMKSAYRNWREHKEKAQEWEKGEAERKQKLTEELGELKELQVKAIKENKRLNKDIEKLERKYEREEAANNKKLAEMDVPHDFDKEIEALEREHTKAVANQSSLLTTYKQHTTRNDTLATRIETANEFVGEPCEVCGTVITQEHIPYMVKELMAEQNDLKAKLLDLDANKVVVTQEITNIQRQMAELKDKRDAQKDLQEARTNLRLYISGLQSKKVKELAALKEDLIPEDVFDKEQARLTNEIAKEAVNPYVELFTKEKTSLIKMAQDDRDVREEINGVYTDLKTVDFWVKGFSNGGMVSFLLDSITGTINRGISYYLTQLSESRISARLHTVKKLASGEYRENYHIELKNLDGRDSFTSLSSGAKTRVDMAVSLAVTDFKRSLSHKDIKFIVFDEVLSAVDAYWEAAFFKLLREKYKDFSVYVISHKELPEELFDGKIVVQKKNGVTSLQ